MCLESIKNETPPGLSVVINCPVQQTTAAASNALDALMAASKPTLASYQSAWDADDVITFHAEYEAAPNKATYLSSLPKKDKPSIDEQIEAFGASFLTDHGLGYKGGTGGEDTIAKNGMRLMLATLKFVNDRRSVMGRSHVGMYECSAMIQDVKSCVSAKTNREREN